MRCALLLLALASPPEPPAPPVKPPLPWWEVTTYQLEWPAPMEAPSPWGCRGGKGAKLVLDRVRVLPDKPHTDAVEVWLSFLNATTAPCTPPVPSLFTDRGLQREQRLPNQRSWTSPAEARGSGRVQVSGDVPIGTRALWLILRESPLQLRIDLQRGSASLVGPDRAVVASAEGRRLSATPDPHPSYVKIPVGERFPGASMVQADGGGGCARYYDLGVDGVYLVRGVDSAREVVDQLVLDATFYRMAREPPGNPDCHTHVSMTERYAHRLLPGGFTEAGAPPDSRVTTFGTRQLRRFSLEPGTEQVTLVFGDPGAQEDVLSVDLRQRAAAVVKRSAPPRLTPARDLLPEWLERDRDPAGYLLAKYVRGRWMRTDANAPSRDSVCRELAPLFGPEKPYVPAQEAEPLRETFKVLCSEASGAGR